MCVFEREMGLVCACVGINLCVFSFFYNNLLRFVDRNLATLLKYLTGYWDDFLKEHFKTDHF